MLKTGAVLEAGRYHRGQFFVDNVLVLVLSHKLSQPTSTLLARVHKSTEEDPETTEIVKGGGSANDRKRYCTPSMSSMLTNGGCAAYVPHAW